MRRRRTNTQADIDKAVKEAVAATVAQVVEQAADASSQDAQVIVTSLGNIESMLAEEAPESFCAHISEDFERAMKAALNLPKRIRSLTYRQSCD